jgi:hypothetical protein
MLVRYQLDIGEIMRQVRRQAESTVRLQSDLADILLAHLLDTNNVMRSVLEGEHWACM